MRFLTVFTVLFGANLGMASKFLEEINNPKQGSGQDYCSQCQTLQCYIECDQSGGGGG